MTNLSDAMKRIVHEAHCSNNKTLIRIKHLFFSEFIFFSCPNAHFLMFDKIVDFVKIFAKIIANIAEMIPVGAYFGN